MSNSMKRNKKQIVQNSKTIILTAIIFFAITMPFRRLFRITGLTEVRPASALPPVAGLAFGLPGALGCALGNLAADGLSGYPASVCGFGFAAQLLYGYLTRLLWYGPGVRREKDAVCLGRVRFLCRYIMIMAADSLFMAGALGIFLQMLSLGKLFSSETLLLFFNNLLFCLILGIPLLLLADLLKAEDKKKALTLNVRFILFFLLLGIGSAVLEGISAYYGLSASGLDKVHLWNNIYMAAAVDFLLLCFMTVCILHYVEKHISVPLERLAAIAAAYAGRKRPTEVTKRQGAEAAEQCRELADCHGEVGALAGAFREMLLEIEEYIEEIINITAKEERIHTELMVASALQRNMLPDFAQLFPGCPEFVIRADMTPAKEVGGDFYDFFPLDEDRLAFLIADVSGKGVPAALFMVVAKTLIQSHTRNTDSAAEAFAQVNKELCANNPGSMFVTAWMGILTVSTGRLAYVNAGHMKPLIKKDGSYSFLEGETGFVLGGMEDTRYIQQELYLNSGDTVFLYTDGVTEAGGAEGRFYGERRLLYRVNCLTGLEPEELNAAVLKDVKAFQSKAEQYDDITVLTFCYKNNGYRVKNGKADITNIPAFDLFLKEVLQKAQVAGETAVKIRVAADEILSNICFYSQADRMELGCRVREDTVSLYFEDNGVPYNPLEGAEPEITAPAENRKEGGLGVYLVKKRMDKAEYEYADGKNRLYITKNR